MKPFNQSPCYLKDGYEEGIQDACYIIDHLKLLVTPDQVSKKLSLEEAENFYMYKAKFEMVVQYLVDNGVHLNRWVRIPNWNSQEVANQKWYNYNKKWER